MNYGGAAQQHACKVSSGCQTARSITEGAPGDGGPCGARATPATAPRRSYARVGWGKRSQARTWQAGAAVQVEEHGAGGGRAGKVRMGSLSAEEQAAAAMARGCS